MADPKLKDMFDYLLRSVPDATRIRVKWGDSEMEAERALPPLESGRSTPRPPQAKPDAGANMTLAPLVGVFYTAPSPDAEPFVTVGQRVKKGDALCIIEAMKLMNEIESAHDGVIAAVLAENGAMVEYGQPLFEITP